MSIKDGIVLRICRGPTCAKHAAALESASREHIEAMRIGGVVGIAEEICFGRCAMAPNLLVERWREGHRNEQAMLSLMMGVDHPDMRFESGVRPKEVPALIDWHLRAWLADRNS